MKYTSTKERLIKNIFLGIAILSSSLILFIFVFLFRESLPAFQELGAGLFSSDWSMSQGNFGLIPALLGSVLVTIIALIISIPVGISTALFMSEIAPPKIRKFMKPVIEILAGIPSVVYGFFGVVIFIPFIKSKFGLSYGYTIFTGGVVIGIMALPIIISISDDAFQAVPSEMKEASLALGATKWQTMKDVTYPAAISGVATSAIMGAGRAIGETMAVTLVVGSQMDLPEPFFDAFESGDTLTSLIAGRMGEAVGIETNVLFAAGVILFIIVGILSLSADYLQQRVEQKFEGG